MTSAYDRTLTVQTLGEGEGGSGVSPLGEEYFIAEVKFLHFKHPARFGGKLHGRPDFQRKKRRVLLINNNGDQFRWKKNMKNYIAVVRVCYTCKVVLFAN